MRYFVFIISVIVLLSLPALSCKTSDSLKESDENLSLKYPVVFVHGIVAHDRESIINFWGRIPDFLRENNIEVFFGNTDAWGVYESNAEILKNTIETVLKTTNSEKVNIIAHSKGGIDSRYMIWKYNMGDKVASLTTICTPHHGNEIADLIYNRKFAHTKLFKRTLEVFGKLYGDTNPDMYNLKYQITTAQMKEFNEKVILDERVYFQSLYSTMNSSFDDLLCFYSYMYLKRFIGNNDGVVSEKSAMWGDNARKIAGRVSHVDILDVRMRNINGVNIKEIYKNIVKDLSEKGF